VSVDRENRIIVMEVKYPYAGWVLIVGTACMNGQNHGNTETRHGHIIITILKGDELCDD
jgi:hypothetical protein